MAQTIQLRRSAVQGVVPTTAQLQLGEIAINTYDGKVFIKRNDGDDYIVQLNPLNTGELAEGSNLYYTDARVNAALATLVTTDHIDLTTTSNPAHSEGRIFYDDANKALAVYNSEADITLQVGQEEWVRVYNNTGSTISDGTPVLLSGSFSDVPTIALADATTYDDARAVGLTTHTIENATYGFVTTRGIVQGLDTSAYTAGSPVHVAVSPGTLQTGAPTYPYWDTEVGICLVSDASNGCIYVSTKENEFKTLRVEGDARVDGNLTVAGDLSILGNQSTVSLSNLAVDDTFIYLNSGDTIGDANTAFTGSGLDDAVFTGHYEGTTTKHYYVRIDGVGTGTGGVDTFEWSFDNFATTEATGVDITGAAQLLASNISIDFNATTGHTSGDKWDGDAAPLNVDSGWASNRNTGATGVGYTHIGMFFDITDQKFKVFKAYDPEPEGDINTAHASFELGTLVIDSVEATTLSGALTGNVTGNLSGNVTGTVSSLANQTTTNLAEGTNQYFTTGRVQSVVTKSYVEGLAIDYTSLTAAPDALSDLTNDMWEVTSTVPTDGTGKPAGYVWYIV